MWENALAAGAEGDAVVPFPADVWQRTLDDAIADGIPVVALNVPAPESNVSLYVGVNEVEIGREQGQAALDAIGADAEGDHRRRQLRARRPGPRRPRRWRQGDRRQ